MAIFPGKEEYLQRAALEKVIPIWQKELRDTETPISIYQKVVEGNYSFLLESVEGGEQVARYTFMGYDPFLIFQAKNGVVWVEEEGRLTESNQEPFERLQQIVEEYRIASDPSYPRFFGGAVGYMAYDAVRYLETIPNLVQDQLNLPDCFLIVPRVVLIYDHVLRTLQKVVLTKPGPNPLQSYDEAVEELDRITKRLDRLNGTRQTKRATSQGGMQLGKYASNLTEDQYLDMVRQAKYYITEGEIFQVVLSQRLQTKFQGDPLRLYGILRSINPSPYMFYLDFDNLQMIGASPEMLVRVEGDKVQHRPIAGTRPRGRNQQEDLALSKDLAGDPKERAEHLMLVDLGRNDLGRVCARGSVHVPQFMQVEYYSHVMHLVSVVEGKLAQETHPMEALKACFPAGTVSGAPKIRAMEIIEELEPTRRGPYAGAVGYISSTGNIDTCIAIRTILLSGGYAYVQAGAGIVADSVPQKEYQETLNKAKALLAALAKAGEEI